MKRGERTAAEVKSDLSFEEALARLEEVVRVLEEGNLPLEEVLNLFQEGISLSRFCHACLREAETKIEVLLREEENMRMVSLEEAGLVLSGERGLEEEEDEV